MKTIKHLIASALVMIGVIAAPLVLAPSAFAVANPQQSACEGTGGTWTGTTCAGNSAKDNIGPIINTVVNILLYAIGIIAVIMIIIGAIRFVISGGNASAVAAAKNTILYAVIGLIVAFIAFALVNFVLANIAK